MRNITLVGTYSRSISQKNVLRSISMTVGFPCQSVVNKEKTFDQGLCKEATSDPKDVSENTHTILKKFAMLMAYCGSGYHGMQLTKSGLPTIEGELISALVQAQCIPETYSSDLQLLQFQRCARTDKGVSALAQVVSLNLFETCTNPMEKINSYLPPEIRVLGIKRVPKRFICNKMCDARTYSYTLPTFALSRYAGSTPDTSFRLPREDFHHIIRLLSFYKGTHNFHNFTKGKLADDKSAHRHIFDIFCSEPFVRHDVEFARILIKGQSFMLHQIRKMVGLIIALAQGVVSADCLPQSVQKDKVKIPIAPALGLVLEFTHFEHHNQRPYYDNSLHQRLTWEEVSPTIDAFREEKIIRVIIGGELRDLSMSYWLNQISTHRL
ncbi:pseudouridylate synthase 1 homolog [Mixophyes fleayi]|uniref:pseudouridylate synthase 1 homolog n=1 Tax=Mixophyes fleayi TaxID=3061075 RepID=UPI003F4DB518